MSEYSSLVPPPEQPVADFNEPLLPEGSLTLLRAAALPARDESDNWSEVLDLEGRGAVFVYDHSGIGNSILHYNALSRIFPFNGLENDAFVELATTHLQKVQNLGLAMVSHSFERRQDLSEEERRHVFTRQILAGRKDIPETQPVCEVPKRVLPQKRVKAEIIGPVQAYYEWCKDSDQAFYLPRLVNTDNYRYHEPSQTPYLDRPEPDLWFSEEWTLDLLIKRDLPSFVRSLSKRARF